MRIVLRATAVVVFLTGVLGPIMICMSLSVVALGIIAIVVAVSVLMLVQWVKVVRLCGISIISGLGTVRVRGCICCNVVSLLRIVLFYWAVRLVAVAVSILLLTALTISGLFSYLALASVEARPVTVLWLTVMVVTSIITGLCGRR